MALTTPGSEYQTELVGADAATDAALQTKADRGQQTRSAHHSGTTPTQVCKNEDSAVSAALQRKRLKRANSPPVLTAGAHHQAKIARRQMLYKTALPNPDAYTTVQRRDTPRSWNKPARSLNTAKPPHREAAKVWMLSPQQCRPRQSAAEATRRIRAE